MEGVFAPAKGLCCRSVWSVIGSAFEVDVCFFVLKRARCALLAVAALLAGFCFFGCAFAFLAGVVLLVGAVLLACSFNETAYTTQHPFSFLLAFAPCLPFSACGCVGTCIASARSPCKCKEPVRARSPWQRSCRNLSRSAFSFSPAKIRKISIPCPFLIKNVRPFSLSSLPQVTCQKRKSLAKALITIFFPFTI